MEYVKKLSANDEQQYHIVPVCIIQLGLIDKVGRAWVDAFFTFTLLVFVLI